MKALIVNADDLGWTEGVNRGILEAHRNGIVSSATLLANGPAFDSAAAMARATPTLGIGVHLNLSDGPPVSSLREVASLVNAQGNLHSGPLRLLLRRGRIRLEEVAREWSAQIQKVRDAGIRPTHLDGHKHVHMLPGIFEIAVRLAAGHGIRAIRVAQESALLGAHLSARDGQVSLVKKMQVRGFSLLSMNAKNIAAHAGLASADYFCGIAHTGALTRAGVSSLLKNLPEGVTELMTHPGYTNEELRGSATRLQASREAELAVLTAPELRNLLASRGIRLVDYAYFR